MPDEHPIKKRWVAYVSYICDDKGNQCGELEKYGEHKGPDCSKCQFNIKNVRR